MSQSLNKYSARITQRKSQGASQAMLYGTGLTEEDMKKAQVGIASVWYEGNTCNMHLLELAEAVKAGVSESDLVGLRFNTIGVSDGISMGTEGMKASLVSREVIADSIETVTFGESMDGLVVVAACDKNMPGAMMAIARLNVPSIFVYGGAIMVLYLFVIMLINPRDGNLPKEGGAIENSFAGGVSLLIFSLLAFAISHSGEVERLSNAGGIPALPEVPLSHGGIAGFGLELFHNHLLVFELTSVLILVGIIGAVHLAMRRKSTALTSEEAAEGAVTADV